MRNLIDKWNTLTPRDKVAYSITAIVILIILSLFFEGDVQAGGNHGHDINLNLNYSEPSSTVTEVHSGMGNDEFDKAQAMSAAGGTCVFDYADGWQGCFGGGWYGSASAINGSLVTRIDNFAVRVNLQSDTDFDEQAIGLGGSWHF